MSCTSCTCTKNTYKLSTHYFAKTLEIVIDFNIHVHLSLGNFVSKTSIYTMYNLFQLFVSISSFYTIFFIFPFPFAEKVTL